LASARRQILAVTGSSADKGLAGYANSVATNPEPSELTRRTATRRPAPAEDAAEKKSPGDADGLIVTPEDVPTDSPLSVAADE
jgi:hypothetical protein